MTPPSFLIVDDDEGTRETVASIVRKSAARPLVATSHCEALALVGSQSIEAALIDLRLPDGDGLAVARSLRSNHPVAMFAMMSAWMTVELAVQAMRLGAFDVLEKPISIETFRRTVRGAMVRIQDATGSHPSTVGGRADRSQPAGLADRWASLVRHALQSEGDFRTVAEWGHAVGVSGSTLREICRLLRIRPRDARDFARMLRAIARAGESGSPPEVWLNVSDRRTLVGLLRRAGLLSPSAQATGLMSVSDFLEWQTFIDPYNEAFGQLCQGLMSARGSILTSVSVQAPSRAPHNKRTSGLPGCPA